MPPIRPTISAMHRRLVASRLVDPNTFRVEASDGKVCLHHVEFDEQAHPIPGQIDRWLNLLWAPPGMDAVLNDPGAQPGTVCFPRTGESALTRKAAGPIKPTV